MERMGISANNRLRCNLNTLTGMSLLELKEWPYICTDQAQISLKQVSIQYCPQRRSKMGELYMPTQRKFWYDWEGLAKERAKGATVVEIDTVFENSDGCGVSISLWHISFFELEVINRETAHLPQEYWQVWSWEIPYRCRPESNKRRSFKRAVYVAMLQAILKHLCKERIQLSTLTWIRTGKSRFCWGCRQVFEQ